MAWKAQRTLGNFAAAQLAPGRRLQCHATRRYPTSMERASWRSNLASGDSHWPESTRWESTRCIDWSVQKGFLVPPYCQQEKFADHKVLCYDLLRAAVPPAKHRRICPAAFYPLPEHLTSQDWQHILSTIWDQQWKNHPVPPTWDEFTKRLGLTLQSPATKATPKTYQNWHDYHLHAVSPPSASRR